MNHIALQISGKNAYFCCNSIIPGVFLLVSKSDVPPVTVSLDFFFSHSVTHLSYTLFSKVTTMKNSYIMKEMVYIYGNDKCKQ
jgi:hypothetical protein